MPSTDRRRPHARTQAWRSGVTSSGYDSPTDSRCVSSASTFRPRYSQNSSTTTSTARCTKYSPADTAPSQPPPNNAYPPQLHGTHRVKRVSADPGARVVRSAGLAIARAGVTDGHDDARSGEPFDRGQSAVELRRDRHQSDGSVRGSHQVLELGPARWAPRPPRIGLRTRPG